MDNITAKTSRNNLFEAVKSEVNIKELYRELTGHDPDGRPPEYSIRCPLPGHEDQNPSASLNPQRGVFNCQVCGEGGTVIDLVSQNKAMDVLEAARWLAERYNVPYSGLSENERRKLEQQWENKKRRRNIMFSFVEYAADNLDDQQREHLRNRGLSDDTIDSLKIGYEDREKPDDPERAADIGLMSEDNYLAEDRYIIPIFQHSEPVYLVLYDPDSDRKYMNLKDQEIPLWGIDNLTDDNTWFVEGPFDYLSLVEAGLNGICSLGTSLKDAHIQRLRDTGTDLKIALDPDTAGQEAARKLATSLWPDSRPDIVQLPDDKDPNDILVEAGDADTFRERLNELPTETILEKEVSELAELDDMEQARNMDRPLELIKGLPQLERERWIKKLSELTDLGVTAVRDQLKNTEALKDVPWFTAQGEFIPRQLGRKILDNDHYLTLGNKPQEAEIRRYRSGVFDPGGEGYLRKKIQKVLGDDWKRTRQNGTVEWIKNATHKRRNELKENPELINVRNGMYDLFEKKLRSHSPNHESLIQFPVEYDPDAQAPELDDFITDVIPADCVDLLWEFVGWTLLDDTDTKFKKSLILTGEGNNGKSTLINLLFTRPIGRKYIGNESLQDLGENRFSVANLFGKVANIYADLESNAVRKTGIFKHLTGGDRVRGERKGEDAFYFDNRARLIFSCNNLPTVRDYNEAFFDRLLIVPCPNEFTGEDDDPDIEDRLDTEEVRSYWFKKAVEGARRLYDQGEFSIPDTVKNKVSEYRKKADTVTAFISEALEVTGNPDDYEVKKHVYSEYEKWCGNTGHNPVSYENFCTRAKRKPNELKTIQPRSENQKRCWKGVKLQKPR
jgi:putative DNA primase/helicase